MVTVVATLMFLAAPAAADWDIGDPHKMHEPQLPKVDGGWDVMASYYVFLADDWKPPFRQVMGSIATGKTRVLLDVYDTPRQMPKPAHAHTYLSRDLKWAIFNSDRSGPILLYAARVPDEFVAELLKT